MTWQYIRIGDIGRVMTGDTPPKSQPDYYGSAFPFIKPTDMKVGQRYTLICDEGYSDVAYEKYEKKLIPEGATAVVTIGSIGQKLTLTHTPCFVNQAVNAVIPDSEKFDPKFVFYLLKHNLKLVKQADTGASSGRENVSKSNFSSLQVYATLDKHEQVRIGQALDSFDSAIENNQRRIELLEESARLLYRSWFVGFRFPGAKDLKSISGVPTEWDMGSVEGLAATVNRGITPRYDDSATGLVINQKCIRGGRLNLEPARRQSKEVKEERLLRVGDVLINSTGAGTLGRVAQVRAPLLDCTVDTHVTIVRPRDPKTAAYLGVALLEKEALLSTMGVGSTNQLELLRADISALPLVIPPEEVQSAFHELVWPMFTQAESLALANERLREARDALLPKLMSGALAV
ncbi:MAG: restriction endonuclease subunit S [Acidobacteriota bacterium]